MCHSCPPRVSPLFLSGRAIVTEANIKKLLNINNLDYKYALTFFLVSRVWCERKHKRYSHMRARKCALFCIKFNRLELLIVLMLSSLSPAYWDLIPHSSVIDSLRRRANARNVSFRISLRWTIHIINPVDKTKLSCNTPTDTAPQFL